MRRLEDNHPFQAEIDACEVCLTYCNANLPTPEEAKDESQPDEEMTAQQKQVAADIASGKLIEGLSKEERDQELAGGDPQQKKPKNKGVDKSKVASDKLAPELQTIMMFGKLGVSPPVKREELEAIIKTITEIMEALQTKGRLEQIEAKAELLKDEEILKSEEYLALSENYKNQNEETLKRL